MMADTAAEASLTSSKTARTRLHRLRLLENAHDDLGRDAEGALGAHEHARQIEAERVARAAAQPHDLAVGHDHFEAEHVVGGHAVLERVRAAGVVGDVAADGARLLAGRIGGVVVAAWGHRVGEVQVDQPRLHHRDLVVVVDLQHAVHAHERDHEAAFRGQAAARQSRARPARHEGQALAAGELDDGGHVRDVGGKDDEVRERPEEREAVGLVDEQLLGIGQHAAGPHDRFQLAAKGALALGSEGGHQREESIPSCRHSRRSPWADRKT